jgi:hypothetical protein
MTRINLNINGEEYQYIVCNINFNSNIQTRIKNIINQNNINTQINTPRVSFNTPRSSFNSNSDFFESYNNYNFYIYIVSLNNIKYTKYFKKENIIINLNKLLNGSKLNEYNINNKLLKNNTQSGNINSIPKII